MSKFILIVLVLAGDNAVPTVIGFNSMENCLTAKTFIVEAENFSDYKDRDKPYAECFER